jgi:hypothetical protein
MTLFISLYQIIATRQNIFHTYGMDNYFTGVNRKWNIDNMCTLLVNISSG